MKIINNAIENAYFPIFKLYASRDNISSDLSLKYINQDNKLTLSIIGEKLKLGTEGLLPFFNFNTSSDSLRDILLDINFDTLVARSGLNYKNVKFFLEKNSNLINSFQISANLNNEKIIESTFSDKKKIEATVTNIGPAKVNETTSANGNSLKPKNNAMIAKAPQIALKV